MNTVHVEIGSSLESIQYLKDLVLWVLAARFNSKHHSADQAAGLAVRIPGLSI